jgi:four helix bundle protein
MPLMKNDLVDRTMTFAIAVRRFVNGIPRLPSNYEDGKQLIRSSGSVAANYLEAQEGLSRKDFCYRIKVSRKEASEMALWLQLLQLGTTEDLIQERDKLFAEAQELRRILSAIAAKDDTQN